MVIVLLIWQFYAGSKRRKELAAWAEANQLQFDPAKDREMDSRFPDFHCLAQGHSRYAYNVMSGRWHGRDLLGFDYHYQTGSGKSAHDYHFSTVILSSTVPLKPLFLRHEGVFDKMTEFLGFHDIEFESSEFNRSFYVKAPDKRWAYDVIHPRTMELLLNSPRFSIQFDSQQVMAYRASTFSLQDFQAAADLMQGILDGLPDYVIKQQTGQA